MWKNPPSGTDAQFFANPKDNYGPRGIAIDSNDNVYITNRDSASITKFTNAGSVAWTQEVGEQPWGIAIDALDRIFVANEYDDESWATIDRFTPDGSKITFETTFANANLRGVTAKPDGTIYVAMEKFGAADEVIKIGPAFNNSQLSYLQQSYEQVEDNTNIAVVSTSKGDIVWTTNPGSGNVSRFDPVKGLEVIDIPGNPEGIIAVDRYVYITTSENKVYTNAPAYKSTPSQTWGQVGTTGQYPMGLAFDEVRGAFTIANKDSNNLTRIISYPPSPTTPEVTLTGLGEVSVSAEPSKGGPQTDSMTIQAFDEDDNPVDGMACQIEADDDPQECTIDGLTPDVAYTFKANATNELIGTGNFSEPSDPMYPGPSGAPGKPTVEAVAPGVIETTVVPPTTLGVPETYIVQAYDSLGDPVTGKTCTVAASEDPAKCAIEGLDKNNWYTVTVTAENVSGLSSASAQSVQLFPNILPGVPSVERVTVDGSGDVTVAIAPSEEGGDVDSFTVQAFDSDGVPVDGKSCTVPAGTEPLACQIQGLDPAEEYSFKVNATNSAGTTADSSATPPVIPGPPGQPGTPTVAIDDPGTAVITVTPPTAGGVPTNYVVQALDENGDPIEGKVCTVPANASPLSCSIDGLDVNSEYSFEVVAENGIASSEPSSKSDPVSPNVVPGAPGAPFADVTDDGQATVTVVPPTEGGAPTKYTVQAVDEDGVPVPAPGGVCTIEPDGDGNWPDPQACVLNGLDPGKAYTFEVQAENSAGTSSASPESTPIVPGPPGVPGKPTVEMTEPGKADVTVVPPVTGGTPSQYILQAFDSNGDPVPAPEGVCTIDRVDGAWPDPLTCTIEGLDPNEEYTFEAQAKNGADTSAFSEASDPIYANVPPSVPGAPFADVTDDGQATVTVVPPTEGGAPTKYTVQAVDEDGVPVPAPGGVCTIEPDGDGNWPDPQACVIDGLDPAKAYTFAVQAENSAGTSAVSPESSPVIPGPPGIPGKPTVVIDEPGKADVTVVPPAGGGTPGQYLVQALDSNGDPVPAPEGVCTIDRVDGAWPDPLSCSIEDLDPNETYSFEVQAKNGADTSDFSPASDPVSPNVVPGTPGTPFADVTDDGQATVTVVPPTEGGAPAKYTVQAIDDNGVPVPAPGGVCTIEPDGDGVWPDPQACVIDGLDPAKAYTFAVQAENSAGTSAVSSESSPVIPGPPGVPGKPTVEVNEPGTATVIVTPPADGGTPNQYIIQAYGPDGEPIPAPEGVCMVDYENGAWPDPLACNIEGLDPALDYTFEVQAKNGADTSVPSEASDPTNANQLPGTPTAPTAQVSDEGEATVTVNPSTEGGAPTKYTVQAIDEDGDPVPAPEGVCTIETDGDGNWPDPLACVIDGLDPAKAYTFEVKAENSAGTSAVSPESSPVIPGPPGIPAAPTAVVDGMGSVTVTVEPATEGGTPSSYSIQAFDGEGNPVPAPDGVCVIEPDGDGAWPDPLSCTFSSLNPLEQYTFEVEASNGAGTSEPSEVSNPVTPNLGPVTPAKPEVAIIGLGEVMVTINPGEGGGLWDSYYVTAYNHLGNPVDNKTCVAQPGIPPSCVISGLDPSRAYTFKTESMSDRGVSDTSVPSDSVVPGPPGSPGTPQVKPGKPGEVQITIAPATTGGIPDSYTVQALDEEGRPVDGATCTVAANANPLVCTIGGLDYSGIYTFVVVAENQAGDSVESAESEEIAGGVVPAAPGRPSAKQGQRSGEVLVTIPPSTGGGAAASYTVTSRPGGQTCTVPATAVPLQCVVRGLNPGSSYTFTAIATNAKGSSVSSQVSSAVKSGARMTRPTRKPASLKSKGKPTSKSYTVSWKRPSNTNAYQRPVTGYRLTVNLRGKKRVLILKNLKAKTTKYKLTRKQLLRAAQRTRGEVNRGYVFTVKVRAFNSQGLGPAASTRIVLKAKR